MMFRALWICGSAGQSRDDRRAIIFAFCEILHNRNRKFIENGKPKIA
jgi:hypothetical protein